MNHFESGQENPKVIDVKLQLPEKPAVNFDALKKDFLEPLRTYVGLSGAGDLSFDYQNDEMIGVLLVIKNGPTLAIDFYLDGSIVPENTEDVDSRDWITGARKIIETVVASVESAELAAGQLEKLKRAAQAMQDELSR
jgi:hypothetical protein